MQCMLQEKNGLNVQTPVIALTANAIAGVKEMYLQAGFTDYLSKPVEASALEGMIIKYLPNEKQRSVGESSTEMKENLTLFEQVKKLLPELDTATAMEYCGDDESIYQIAVESYCQQDFSEKLSAFFREKDMENYQIIIHGVKSSSLIIGLCQLSEQAKKLEQACKDKDWEYVEVHHPQVYKDYVAVLNKLNSMIF